jgi:hypothetical protein
MAQSPFLTDPTNPANSEILGLERQRKLAEMLQQRGMKTPEGQMVSGRYVAPSWSQYLANAFDVYGGAQGQRDVEQKQAELAQMLRKKSGEDVIKYNELMYGAPEQAVYGAGMEGPTKQITSPEVVADPSKAFQLALSSSSPILNQMAVEQLKSKTFKEGEIEMVFNPRTGKREQVAQGNIKLPSDIQGAAIFLGLQNKDPNTWTQQERTAVENKAKEFRQSGAMNTGQKGLDNTLKLRADFRSEPVYKDFQAIDSAYRQINKGLDAGNAAGDLAASTKLMKLLDPTSVVRESELVMAMQATGKLDQLYNYANKIATGQFLSPTQKEQFRGLAKEFYNSAGEQYNLKRKEYADIAQRNELNVPDVVGSEVRMQPTSGSKKTPPPPQIGQVVDGYRFKGGNPADPKNYEKVN